MSSCLDRQRRRGADGDDRREPRCPCFLDHLDAGGSADEQTVATGREVAGEQQRTDDLVDSVVTADVFANKTDVAIAVEGRCRVHRTGRVEQPLVFGDEVGDPPEQAEWHRGRGFERGESCVHLVELFAAAPTAARRGGAEPRSRCRRAPLGVDGDDVESALDGAAVGAVLDSVDRSSVEQALGVAVTDGELEIVARGTHGRGDDRAVELDRHRLLDDQVVGTAAGTVGRHFGDEEPL